MRLLHDFLTEEEATEIMRVAEPRFSRSPVCLTRLEPQPSRLQMDLPLTRASPALDSRSAAEAQRFYEKSFYDGRVLVHEPVLAIPVAMVGWVEE